MHIGAGTVLTENQVELTKLAGGEFIISPQYEYSMTFSDGLAGVYIDGLYGYIDTTGNIVIEPKYNSALNFKNGIALAETSDGYGRCIDKSGKKIIPIRK